MLKIAEKQLSAEQSLTDADIELIVSVWASKTMQNDELIRERYIVEEQFNDQTGLVHSLENGIIHDWLEDRERQPRYKLQTWQEEHDVSICKLMAVELNEALEYTPIVLTSAWRKRLAWRVAERRNDLTNAYLLWKTKVAMTSGGSCKWTLSAVNLGIEYIDATHLGKDLVPGTAVGATLAFDNDASRNGQFYVETGNNLKLTPDYYPLIHTNKRIQKNDALEIFGKEDFIQRRITYNVSDDVVVFFTTF